MEKQDFYYGKETRDRTNRHSIIKPDSKTTVLPRTVLSIHCMKPLRTVILFILLGALLWSLRSWNLEIGDGEFCCKQTVGEQAFAVTLSRSFLSYVLYRTLYFSLHPAWDWWVEDIIALSSCAAGLVFFYSLYRLALASSQNKTDFWIFFLFPSTTMILQVFCGHIEFYPWTCALLMSSAWLSWEAIHHQRSLLWPSTAMMLAAAFHSSGVFYFPALLVLPFVMEKKDTRIVHPRPWELFYALAFFVLFVGAALLHRKPTHWLFVFLVVIGTVLYPSICSPSIKRNLSPWWNILFPWLVLFAVRAVLQLRAEPLLEHLPPWGEPYDHGAYLYEAFSWKHLEDKVFFHYWLAPFGLVSVIAFCITSWKRIASNRWLLFLLHFCFWTLVWSILFYPQLRKRDWDLFATMSIALNLFAVYGGYSLLSRTLFRGIAIVCIFVQLTISLPVIVQNSSLLEGRGYVVIQYDPQPVPTHAYIRGLQLGITPVQQRNIRSGKAEIRMVPLQRGYQSWVETVDLEAGKTYRFEPVLQKAGTDIHPPIPHDP